MTYQQNFDDLDCRAFAAKMDEWASLPADTVDWAAIDAVIFDMDGTLVDSMFYWAHLTDDWFNRQGMQVPGILVNELATADLGEAAALLAQKYAREQTTEEAVFAELQAKMDAHYANDIPLLPGRRELLAALAEKNIPACIATMTDRPQVQTVLKTHGIAQYFKFALTTPEVGRGKTEPDIFLQAAARLGSQPARTMVVEDSRTAIKTAIKAGFAVLAVRQAGVDYAEIERLAAQNAAKLWYADDFLRLLPIAK